VTPAQEPAPAGAVTIGDTRTRRSASSGRLAHLGDLADVEVAPGEPDLRGWEVRGPLEHRVGKVLELLIDAGAMKVRYLEVKLDQAAAAEVARTAGDTDSRSGACRCAIVPIGLARLDRWRRRVYLSFGAAQLIGLPERERREPTREFERAVARGYGLQEPGDPAAGVSPGADRGGAHESSPDRFYEAAHFDECVCFGPRRRFGESSTYIVPAT